MEINLLVTLISGLLIGLTPCVLLMLSAFGGSLVLIKKKEEFIKVSLGLISGFVISYIIITIVLFPWRDVLESLLFKIILMVILIFLGIWQIIESKKEKSIIFGTPVKAKKIMKNFIEQNSFFYAFLVGIIFTFIKFPCFSATYLAIISNVYYSPVLILYIAFYIIGVITPVIIILILIRIGLEAKKVNEFRLKYRRHLRILSGVILIFLSIYLFILDDLLFPSGYF